MKVPIGAEKSKAFDISHGSPCSMHLRCISRAVKSMPTVMLSMKSNAYFLGIVFPTFPILITNSTS